MQFDHSFSQISSKMLVSIFILSFSFCAVFGQSNYCAISRQHTMCQYSPKACSRKTLFSSAVTASDVQSILKAHNDLRNRVASGSQPGQPSASNMKEMVYDNELAAIAQRWADQCSFGHDSNRNTNNFRYVGQNVAITQSSVNNKAADFKKVVQMWFDEVSSFNPRNINRFVSSSVTGHYTQVVWADTSRIGCGFAYYREGSWYSKLYVCNYGPGGNFIGNSVYKTGSPASSCPSGKSNTYKSLCRP